MSTYTYIHIYLRSGVFNLCHASSYNLILLHPKEQSPNTPLHTNLPHCKAKLLFLLLLHHLSFLTYKPLNECQKWMQSTMLYCISWCETFFCVSIKESMRIVPHINVITQGCHCTTEITFYRCYQGQQVPRAPVEHSLIGAWSLVSSFVCCLIRFLLGSPVSTHL